MKKTLSIVLSLIMLLSAFIGTNTTSYAATNEAAKAAIDNLCSTTGYRPGVDNYNNCKVYADAFCNKIYGCTPSGTSGYTLTNPGNFYMVGQTIGTGVNATTLSNLLSQALPGDVVQMNWDYGTGSGQHTAIIYSADESSFTVLQDGASWSTIQKSTYTYSSSYKRWSGSNLGISLYRYKWYSDLFTGSGTFIPNPVVGDNKNYVSVGESITFWYSGLTECSKAEFYFEKDGKVYYTKDSTSSREFTTYFENEGVYNVYAGGYYNGQWYYSSKITIYVFNPKLVSNKTSVNTKEELTFTYSGLTACKNVEICFEKDGKTYYSGDSTSSRVYKNYFEKSGVYYVYAKGTINNYTTTSGKIRITVTCNHQHNKAITKKATCITVGVLTYTCPICNDSYTEDIPKADHNIVTDKAVAPTYTAEGKTQGSHCSVCGETIVAQKTIARLSKKNNPVTVVAKKTTVKYKKLKKKNQTIALKKAMTVSKAQGKVTYAKSSGNKKITVADNGKITVKKGLKKGTYKVKINVTAAGNSTYKAATKTVTVTIKIK